MMTIYLSSTYEDLKDHRRIVFDALRQSGYQVVAMEDYVATEERPVDKCLNDVDRSDIYVGIFAFRYGYVPPSDDGNPDGLSITELEFRRAKGKKPCLVFLVKQGEKWPLNFVDALTEPDKGQRIDRLREYLRREQTASFFSSPYQLASAVQTAVNNLLKKSENREKVPNRTETTSKIAWDVEKDGSPFPGLMHFSRKYAPVFFGRDAEVREVLDRLRLPEGRFLIISGGSGTGKSSLVDAGVLPRIEESGIGEKQPVCVRMVPSQGSHPFDALLRPLHGFVERAGLNVFELAEEMAAKPTILLERIQEIISKGMNRDALVLFLDQMEELFTVQHQDHVKPFLFVLYNAVTETNFRVIATIRSDFLHHCHEHSEMLKVLRGPGHYPLGPVAPYMMRDMIAQPAQVAGLSIPESLVNRLIKETGSEPGNLPLLAFVLQRLFDRRADKILCESVYDALGGIGGAIGEHIEAVETQKIIPKIGSDALDRLPRLLQSLLVVNEEGQPTRRRVPILQFPKDLRALVGILISERLLITEGEGEEATVSLAHEKLTETWPSLSKWIDENKRDLFELRQAEREAGLWEKSGFDLKYLWRVERLKGLQEILKNLSDRKVDPIVKSYSSPQEKLVERLKDISLSHKERLTIGQWLAELGDGRPGVGLGKDGIPDIAWVDIEGGVVQLEDVDKVFDVKSFRIAKYTVTNVQFQAFIDAEDGYRNDKWWKGIKQSDRANEPILKGETNCPRETVSWFEALAFCRWLSEQTGLKIRLPTEWEWQLAATGGDPEREYPWPGGWDATRCNSNESRLNRTSAVGLYPSGATQQGVLDMAGNVREWCLNKVEELGTPESVQIDDDEKGLRVIRGGSWFHEQECLRTSYRDWDSAGTCELLIGFRLAQDLE
jgi:formylglycine-generating enzyme required for sulfatase activity